MNSALQNAVTIESIASCIDVLIRKYHDLPEEDRDRMSEQDVRDYFITPLLEAMGWGTVDPRERLAEKYLPRKGFSDYELCLPLGAKPHDKYVPILYVEAKKFGELLPLKKDLFGYERRSNADIQAIEYADEYNPKRGEKIGMVILTNFEFFRLWDTRRGVLVESTDWFNELKRERTLQILYLLSRWQVADDPGLSSLSSYRTLPEIDEEFLSKLNEWRETLAKSIWKLEINRKRLGPNLSAQQASLRDVVQRTLDRLIVIRTAEDRGLLRSQYHLQEMVRNYGGDGAVPLMLLKNIQNNTFRYFDEHYNSKLFGDHLADHMEVHNSPLSAIIQEMCKASFSDMNADILGSTYEQYLGQTIEIDKESDQPKLIPNLETRSAQGIYYTPRYIVQRIVDQTLGQYLYGTENGQPLGKQLSGQGRKNINEIHDLKVLDPACGSGSFLIYSFDVLHGFYSAEQKRLDQEIRSRLESAIQAGVPRLAAEASHDPEILELRSQLEQTRFAHARIVERHLYGVDLDPQAAEVASMNLLLKALTRNERLPRILGDNVKVGNSLVSGIDLNSDVSPYAHEITRLLQIRREIHLATLRASENGKDRAEEEKRIEGLEQDFRSLADGVNVKIKKKLQRTSDDGKFDLTESRHPFNWQVEFPEVFEIDKAAGFTFVLGNPPYVGFHGFSEDKDLLRKAYSTASGKFDIYIPFIERGLDLVTEGGQLSFICPSTFMKRGFGQKLRQYLLSRSSIQSIHDFLHTKIFREALNYTCICVFKRESPRSTHQIMYSEGSLDAPQRLYTQTKLGRSPWVFRFGKEEELVERILSSSACIQLGDPRITVGISEGIVTGKNSVLLLHERDIEKHKMERTFLKKVVRGENVKRYAPEWGGYHVIYPYFHNGDKTAVVSEQKLQKASPKLLSYLRERKVDLETRTYLSESNKNWYEIWCPRDMHLLQRPKIVVPELANRSQFAFVDEEYFYVDTTCGIALSDNCPFDLWYLLAVLNSQAAEYLYRKTTVPKANGFLIYKTMFLSTLRIPVPSGATQLSKASQISRLAQRLQSARESLLSLDRAFEESLQASLPLLDGPDQSFKSDYYDVADYWRSRRLASQDSLDLKDAVANIMVRNDVSSEDGKLIPTQTLSFFYESERGKGWKKIVELEPVNDDLKMFIVLAARKYLTENERKRAWKLKTSSRTVDVLLGSLILPVWGLLHGTGKRSETNLKKIAEVMHAFRTRVRGEANPSILEAECDALDHEIDEIAFDLYQLTADERRLVEETVPRKS